MTNKRTFPGALNAQQRAERQRKIEIENRLKADKMAAEKFAMEQAAQEKQRRANLVKNFGPVIPSFWTVFSGILCVNFLIGGVDRRLFDEHRNMKDTVGADVEFKVSRQDAVREAYDPFFHAGEGDYHYNEVFQYIGSPCGGETKKSYRDSTINNRWKRHMVILGLEALLLVYLSIGKMRKKYFVVKDIDVMLKVEEVAKQQCVPLFLIKKLMKVAPEIVSHMSSESAVYFDLLMKGSFDCEQNPQVLKFAESVLLGHLERHPEDMKRVLAVFDEASLPQSLVEKYKQNAR